VNIQRVQCKMLTAACDWSALPGNPGNPGNPGTPGGPLISEDTSAGSPGGPAGPMIVLPRSPGRPCIYSLQLHLHLHLHYTTLLQSLYRHFRIYSQNNLWTGRQEQMRF